MFVNAFRHLQGNLPLYPATAVMNRGTCPSRLAGGRKCPIVDNLQWLVPDHVCQYPLKYRREQALDPVERQGNHPVPAAEGILAARMESADRLGGPARRGFTGLWNG